MSKIALLTDSTANLPAELVAQHNIHVVPLKIQWGDDSFIDGVTISSDEFYARLESDPVIPTTSQPPMMEFLQIYEKLAEEYDAILVMVISSGLSGTFASATAAASEFDKVPVEIVDTNTTSAGLAMIVLAAVRALTEGCDLAETAVRVRAISDVIDLIFVVDTLKYLHKGGRIGGASRYLGTMLSIKPILSFQGSVEPVTRVRGMKKAMAHLVDIVAEKAGSDVLQVALLHSKSPEKAEILQQMLENKLKIDQIDTFDLSPVIGTHVGTGAVGLAFYPTKIG